MKTSCMGLSQSASVSHFSLSLRIPCSNLYHLSFLPLHSALLTTVGHYSTCNGCSTAHSALHSGTHTHTHTHTHAHTHSGTVEGCGRAHPGAPYPCTRPRHLGTMPGLPPQSVCPHACQVARCARMRPSWHMYALLAC